MSELVKFKGSGALTTGKAFQDAILRTKEAVGVTGNTPFLRLTKGTGEWVYGAGNTDVEENSLWAINPATFQTGYIAWKGGRPVGKKMRPLGQTVQQDELPDVGADWDVNVGFQLQCVHGEDEGTVVEYTANSYGGRKAFSELLSALHAQSEKDQNTIVPVVELLSDFYIHPEWGKTFNPIFQVRKWVAIDGTEAAPPEAPPPNQSPNKAAPAAASAANGTTRRRAAPAVTDVGPAEEPKVPPGAPADPVQRRRRRAAAS